MKDTWHENRYVELSKVAYERDIITYTDFLSLNDIDVIAQMPNSKLYTVYTLFGGYNQAERRVCAFTPEIIDSYLDFPVVCISIKPKQSKYRDKLTHRDYLGSILALGIERCKIGDILVYEDKALVMVHNSMSDYIIENLGKVKNTIVTISKENDVDIHFEQAYEEFQSLVTSVRLDSIIAISLNESRSKIIRLIEGGKVFVNGRLITTNAYKIQDDDLISVRGFGKFLYCGVIGTSRKDKLRVNIKKYM